jgi:asparagine synthase (glutamine-hydrolysing)
VAGVLSKATDGIVPVGDGYYPLGFQIRRFVAGLEAAPWFRLQAYVGGCAPRFLRDVVRPEVIEEAGLAVRSPLFEERLYAPACPLPQREVLSRLAPAALATYCHTRSFLSDDVLRKVDRMSMAHGLEVRAPMLGTRFAEACLRLPSRRKRRGRVGKLILRRWLEASSLSHVTRHAKRGFAIPVALWLRQSLRPVGDELFLSGDSPLREWCRPDRLARAWRHHLDGRWDGRKELWALLTLGAWAWYHLGPKPAGAGDSRRR